MHQPFPGFPSTQRHGTPRGMPIPSLTLLPPCHVVEHDAGDQCVGLVVQDADDLAHLFQRAGLHLQATLDAPLPQVALWEGMGVRRRGGNGEVDESTQDHARCVRRLGSGAIEYSWTGMSRALQHADKQPPRTGIQDGLSLEVVPPSLPSSLPPVLDAALPLPAPPRR